MSIILTGINAFAVDSRVVGSLYDIETFLSHPELISNHYEDLKRRFDNSDFDEVLFPNSASQSPRLSKEDHSKMFEAIFTFFRSQPELNFNEYLSFRPPFNPFSIDYDGQSATVQIIQPELNDTFGEFLNTQKELFLSNTWIKKLTSSDQEELIKYLQKINPEINSLFMISAKKLSSNPKLFNDLISAFGKLIQNKKSYELSQVLAHLLTNYWFQKNHLFGSDLRKLDTLNSYWLRSGFVLDINNIIKNLKLPSTIANNFLSILGFSNRSNFSLKSKKITLVPMTRWEYLFKGIGPGECIRASCNRFFDGLYPFSFGFSILDEGKEIGYINVYETFVKDTNLKRWYIDTVQSPGLVTIAGKSKILSAIIDHIQNLALENNALVAVAHQNWNSINFKENSAFLNMNGFIKEEEVGFPASDTLTSIFEFVAKPEQGHHQKLMSDSGYEDNNKMMYDSLLLNKYRVRVLEPPHSANLFQIDRYVSLTDSYPPSLSNDLKHYHPISVELDRLNRLGFYAVKARLRMIRIFQENFIIIRNSEQLSLKAKETLFPILSKFIKDFNFELPTGEQIEFIKTKIKIEERTNLLIELVSLAKDSRKIVTLIKNCAVESHNFTRILIHLIIPILDSKNFKDWISIYLISLSYSLDQLSDVSLAQAIISKLTHFNEYYEFFIISSGLVKKSGHLGDIEFLNSLISSTFVTFSENYTNDDFFILTERILKNVSTSSAISIKKVLLLRATSVQQINEILKLSVIHTLNDPTSYHLAILKALAKFKNLNSIEGKIFNEILSSLHKNPILNTYARNELIKDLNFTDSKDWLDFYRELLSRSPNNETDLEIAAKVSKKIDNKHFRNFFNISNRKKLYLANWELRSKFFSDEIISRYSLQTDPPDNSLPFFSDVIFGLNSTYFNITILRLIELSSSEKEVLRFLGYIFRHDKFTDYNSLSETLAKVMIKLNIAITGNIYEFLTYNNFRIFDFLKYYIASETLASVPIELLSLAKNKTDLTENKNQISLWIDEKNMNIKKSSFIGSLIESVTNYFYPKIVSTATKQQPFLIKNSCEGYLNNP